MNESDGLIALNQTLRVGGRIYRRLQEALGPIERILDAGREELSHVEGVGPKLADRIREARRFVERVDREREEAQKEGMRIVTLLDEEYPESLREIHDPPLVLYVRGDLEVQLPLSLAIVGSRRCTVYGRIQAERFARELASLGFTIVSGLARGIDTCAARGALDVHGKTIAVLGSGWRRLYPAENRKLAEEIAESGAVISEFPLDVRPEPQNFPRRNRLISGLSLGVLVVEAAERSGTAITVGHALDQGKEVFALPGRVDSPASRGTLRMILDGAHMVINVEQILAELSPQAREILEKEAASRQDPSRNGAATEEEKILLKMLSEDPRHMDELATESGLPPSVVSSTLLMLEMKRRTRKLPGGFYVRE